MITERPRIIAVGGFPGSGKTTVAAALATSWVFPLLGSDLVGATIKDVLDEHHPDPIASRIAH